MAASASPVTPAVIQWAVVEDGRDLPDLADALNVGVDELEGWLSGESALTRGQVSDLARVLRRPRALFFLPRPPELATLPPDFRHPPGDSSRISSKARNSVRQARRLQQAIAWINRDRPPIDMPSGSITTAPSIAASEVREWLGIDEEAQLSWKNDHAALNGWREALDAEGVLVFALEIGRQEIRGFSSWHERAPLVVINSSGVTPAARSYTLAHELGHLYSRHDATCLQLERDELNRIDVERWCEQFGGSLLVPERQLREFVALRGIVRSSVGIEEVRKVASRFRVSHRAAALRLIDLDLAPQVLYGEVVRAFVTKQAESGTAYSPPRTVARVRQYGPRVIETILGGLPPRDALSVLRIEVDDARKLAEDFSIDAII